MRINVKCHYKRTFKEYGGNMNKISIRRSPYQKWQWLLRAISFSVIWLSIVVASQTIQAEEESVDLTTLSIEELLEVRIDQNIVSILHSHIHKKDEWMIGFSSMFMDMHGSRDGTSDMSTASVLANFAVTPTSMHMESSMASLMFAPSDDLTLMAMLPKKSISMDHITRMGMEFTTNSKGIGDLNVMANYVLFRAPLDQQLFIAHVGLSIPTGSIDEKDSTPMGPNQKLPYPMQLGSGTYDLQIGAVYQYFYKQWLFGTHAMGMIRLGENDNDYRLGNAIEIDGWASYEWTNRISSTFRLYGTSWGNISGADPDLVPTMIPTADPDRRGGSRIDLLFDTEIYTSSGIFGGNHFGIEFGMPIYENLEGPQLETRWIISVGWNWIF